MSTANVWEVYDVAANGQPLGRLPGGAVQNVTFTATHGVTAALNNATVGVRIKTDADCYFLCSKAGTAATSSNGIKLLAGETEYFSLRSANGDIISFVAA
jgi:hypothetical protein